MNLITHTTRWCCVAIDAFLDNDPAGGNEEDGHDGWDVLSNGSEDGLHTDTQSGEDGNGPEPEGGHGESAEQRGTGTGSDEDVEVEPAARQKD